MFSFYNKVIVFIIACIFISVHALADDDFDKWQKKENQSFQKYKDDLDQEFSSFLKKRWKAFEIEYGIKLYQEQKPKNLPSVAKSKPKKQTVQSKQKIELPKIISPTKKSVPQKIDQNTKTKKHQEKKAPFIIDYHNTQLSFTLDDALKKTAFQFSKDQNKIAQYWDQISSIDSSQLLDKLKLYKKQLILNDWGFGNLVQHFAEKLYPNSKETQKILIWYLMIKNDYDVALGFSDGAYFILTASKNVLYNTSFIKKSNKPYYVVDFRNSIPKIARINSYQGNYPKKLKMLDLQLTSIPNITHNKPLSKTIQFTFRANKYALELDLNRNINSFLNEYPQTEFNVYFSSPLSDSVQEKIAIFVQQSVKNFSKEEAVNFVLRFVQKGFVYKTDAEQFGAENYLFPDETLFYNASDCEDRVALFNYLVRSVLGLKVISLYYPNHVASAVAIDEKTNGEKISFSGKTYYITDPTYIGADLGMVMPQFKKTRPKIIQL